MAISEAHLEILKYLAGRNQLPLGGDILEIGQATWYGRTEENLREKVLGIYRDLLNAEEVLSIDLGGDDEAMKHDLNEEREPDRRFQIVFNHGTAEHIFNIANVFRFAHDACDVDGVMIHECPFTGWIDHGFYSIQPTLFYDLAHFNHYRIELLAIEDLSTNRWRRINRREEISQWQRDGQLNRSLCLFAALRKLWDLPFKIPTQGVYAGIVSQQVAQAWIEQR